MTRSPYERAGCDWNPMKLNCFTCKGFKHDGICSHVVAIHQISDAAYGLVSGVGGVFLTCSSDVPHMCLTCSLRVPTVFVTCSACVANVFLPCSGYVPNVFLLGSLPGSQHAEIRHGQEQEEQRWQR